MIIPIAASEDPDKFNSTGCIFIATSIDLFQFTPEINRNTPPIKTQTFPDTEKILSDNRRWNVSWTRLIDGKIIDKGQSSTKPVKCDGRFCIRICLKGKS